MRKIIEQQLARRYGSKRGWLNYHKAQFAGWTGRWRPYQSIDWKRVNRLVFICMGNICRSPLAESVARKEGYNAVSMGLNCTPDRPADPRAISFAERHGYELHSHRTSLLGEAECQEGDLLVGMEPRHLSTIQQNNLVGVAQTTLLGLWHDECPTAYIHDPYSTNEEFFQQCEQFVVDSTLKLVKSALHAQREWKNSMPSM